MVTLTTFMSTTSDLHKAIIDVIQYFHFFRYAPQSEHIYMYLPIKISQSSFKTAINQLIEQKRIETKAYIIRKDTFELKKRQKITLYAMRGEGMLCDRTLKHYDFTLEKLKKVRKLLHIIQKMPQVHLIGLSGSCTMGNADKQDDIDIFIITAPGRLWTARFFILSTAFFLGQKRSRISKKAPDKACFNLFFDGLNVNIHERKRNAYTAHEVLQMKPIGQLQHLWNTTYKPNRAYIQREKRMHQHFLHVNNWVFNHFPNYLSVDSDVRLSAGEYPSSNVHAGMGMRRYLIKKANKPLSDFIEKFLGFFQLILIKQHLTSEIISKDQLWFFPKDFERKLKGRL